VSPLDFRSRHLDIISKRQGSTGEWLFEEQHFQAWITGNCRTLFCTGMPGAGKTVLAAIAVDHIQKIFSDANVAVICIYYNRQEDVTDHLRSTPELRQEDVTNNLQSTANLLGSVIRQLAENRITDWTCIRELRRNFRNRQRATLAEEYVTLFKTKLEPYEKIFFVIDGLDECDSYTRQEVLERLDGIGTKARFLLTSRDMTNYEAQIENMERLEVEARSEDLNSYIIARLEASKYLWAHAKNDVDLQNLFKTSIVAKCKGM